MPHKYTLSERIESFWSKVDKSAGEDGCWIWTAAKDRAGYGVFGLRRPKRTRRATHIAYELLVGPIPSGLWLLHSCDNPSCVNPAHLSPGTPLENMRQMIKRGRQVIGDHRPRVGQGNVKLTEAQVREIRRRYAAGGVTHRQLGDRYGVSGVTIFLVVNRRTWSHIP